MTAADALTSADGGARRDLRAVFALGAAAGLGLPALVDGLLLPEIDENAARVVCLAMAGLALSAGWVAGTVSARRISAPVLRLLGAASLAGGCLAAWALPGLHASLVEAVAGADRLPGSLLLTGYALVLTAPLSLPLGALVGLGLDGRPRPTAALLAGAGAGLLAFPWTAEMVLGRAGTAQVAAVVAGAAAMLQADRAPLEPWRARLAWPAAAAALAVGTTAAALAHLLAGRVDLGSVTASWLAACACAGVALGVLAARRLAPGPCSALSLLALPWVVGWSPAILPWPAPDLGADLPLVLGLGLALGWPLGRWLGHAPSPGGVPVSVVPALVLLGLPVSSLILLPHLGPAGVAVVPAALMLAAAGRRPSLAELVPSLTVVAVLLWLPLPEHALALPAEAVHHDDSAIISRVNDPASGRPLLAVDGQAALGRSRLAHRRMVHLPLLLQHADAVDGQLQRVLVVAQDEGEAAQAAAAHHPERLDWLAPLPDPWSEAAARSHGSMNLARGNERLHLLREVGLHEAIILLPDPRVRRRTSLLGTREHFALLRDRLREDGLACQWFDASSIDVTDLKAVIGSALSAFPHVAVLLDHPRTRMGVVGVVCSNRPLSLQLDRIDARLDQFPMLKAELAQVGLDGLLIAALPTQVTGVLRLMTPAERSLDDERPLVGVRALKRSLPWPATAQLVLGTFVDRRCDARAWMRVPPALDQQTRAHTRDLITGWQHLYGGAQQVLASSDGPPPAFEHEGPGHIPDVERAGLVEALAALPDWDWLRAQVTAHAQVLTDAGRGQEAEDMLRAAVSRVPQSASLRFALARTVEARGDRDDACLLYGTVLAFEPRHEGALAARARLGCAD